MAEPEPTPLSALLEPPLADPPPVADLERRAGRLRQRRWAGRGAGAAAVIALVAGAVALAQPNGEQTVRTAAAPPAGGSIGGEGSIGGSAASAAAVVLNTFEHAGKRWQLVALAPDAGAVCTELRTDGGSAAHQTGCWRVDAGPLQATAKDVDGFSFVTAVVAKDAPVVRLSPDTPEFRLLGETAAFPVNFVGFVVPDGVNRVDITAGTAAEPSRYRTSVTVHSRIDSINGQAAPTAPPSTTAVTRAPSAPVTNPPTTLASDTPVSTVVPTPTTTLPGPPPGGNPQRVQVTPGATSLQKRTFESASPAGASSVAVRWWDGVEPCTVLGRVDVSEAADKVTITIWTGIGPGAEQMACVAMAVYKETIVSLSAPLGGRTIVDGA